MALVQKISHPARIGLTIAGMHRSGTSALTGTLSLLGAQPPKTLFSDHWNPKGHFESIPVIEVSNSVLESTGLEVEGWGCLPQNHLPPELEAGFAQRFAQVISAEFSKDLIVVKDPRFCRFPRLIAQGVSLAGWQPLFVLIYRNPFEVAMSMGRRNGLPLEHNLLIWLRFLIDAEQGTRGYPRAFLSYESLLADWRGAINRLQQKLGIILPRRSTRAEAEVDDFLENELRNFNVPGRPSGTALEEWLVGTWDAYVALDENETDTNAQATLDAVNLSLTTASRRLHGLVCRLTEASPPPPVEPLEPPPPPAKSLVEDFSQLIVPLIQSVQQQGQQLSQELLHQIQSVQQQGQQLSQELLQQMQSVQQQDKQQSQELIHQNQELLSQFSALVTEQANVVRDAAQMLSLVPAQIAAEQTRRQRVQEEFQAEQLLLLQERLNTREQALAASIERAARAEAAAEQAQNREKTVIAAMQADAEERLHALRIESERAASALREQLEDQAARADLAKSREETTIAAMRAYAEERLNALRIESEQVTQSLRKQLRDHVDAVEAINSHRRVLRDRFDSDMAAIAHDEKQSFEFSEKISSAWGLVRLVLCGWPKRQQILRPLLEGCQLSQEQQNNLLPWIGRRRILLGLLRRSRSTRIVFVRLQIMSFCANAQHKLWWQIRTEL